MRKIDLATAPDGYRRIRLNNRFLFQVGFLDQGYWPDGIYTAPTDAALRFDIESVKQVGCNLIRKHAKIEPQRWYYWCDRLGVLVWQDMVSGKSSAGGRRHYERELDRMVGQHDNHPSIVMWVPFNEGWGQFDTPRIFEAIKNRDPTRLVNASSGGRSEDACGHVEDIHNYPGPAAPAVVPRDSSRAGVLGEFGGLGLFVEGHTWPKRGPLRGFSAYAERRTDPPRLENTGFGKGWVIPLNLTEQQKRYDWLKWDGATFVRQYKGLFAFVARLRREKGLDAAVYTQLTDVENELNGILTYDRVFKVKPRELAEIHTECGIRTNGEGAFPLFDKVLKDK